MFNDIFSYKDIIYRRTFVNYQQFLFRNFRRTATPQAPENENSQKKARYLKNYCYLYLKMCLCLDGRIFNGSRASVQYANGNNTRAETKHQNPLA